MSIINRKSTRARGMEIRLYIRHMYVYIFESIKKKQKLKLKMEQ